MLRLTPLAAALASALGLLSSPALAQNDDDYRDEYDLQWGLHAIQAEAAYDLLSQGGYPVGGDGVVVAIADDGVGAAPELAGRLVPGPRADVAGNHGTFIAGVIASASDGRGLMGVAFNALVMAMNDERFGQFQSAVQQGASIFSMSFFEEEQGPATEAMRGALYDAARNDVVMVTSLGQGDEAGHGWPVGFAGDPEINGQMIVVGSVDQNMSLQSFPCGERAQAQIGACLVAPGEGIIGAVAPGQEHDERDLFQEDGITLARGGGTSFAVPFVSGAAAILRAARPDLSASEIVSILLDTATPLHAPGEDQNALSPTYGYGLLNLEAAVQAATQ